MWGFFMLFLVEETAGTIKLPKIFFGWVTHDAAKSLSNHHFSSLAIFFRVIPPRNMPGVIKIINFGDIKQYKWLHIYGKFADFPLIVHCLVVVGVIFHDPETWCLSLHSTSLGSTLIHPGVLWPFALLHQSIGPLTISNHPWKIFRETTEKTYAVKIHNFTFFFVLRVCVWFLGSLRIRESVVKIVGSQTHSGKYGVNYAIVNGRGCIDIQICHAQNASQRQRRLIHLNGSNSCKDTQNPLQFPCQINRSLDIAFYVSRQLGFPLQNNHISKTQASFQQVKPAVLPWCRGQVLGEQQGTGRITAACCGAMTSSYYYYYYYYFWDPWGFGSQKFNWSNSKRYVYIYTVADGIIEKTKRVNR